MCVGAVGGSGLGWRGWRKVAPHRQAGPPPALEEAVSLLGDGGRKERHAERRRCGPRRWQTGCDLAQHVAGGFDLSVGERLGRHCLLRAQVAARRPFCPSATAQVRGGSDGRRRAEGPGGPPRAQVGPPSARPKYASERTPSAPPSAPHPAEGPGRASDAAPGNRGNRTGRRCGWVTPLAVATRAKRRRTRDASLTLLRAAFFKHRPKRAVLFVVPRWPPGFLPPPVAACLLTTPSVRGTKVPRTARGSQSRG
jgi:hypothetical protein